MSERYYAEFLYPEIIVSETSLKEITYDDYLNPDRITIPDDSDGFRTMHRNEVMQEGDVLIGSYRNTSGWIYNGQKLSKDDVVLWKGKDSILYRNMENNDYDFVVKTKHGQVFPLHKNDTVRRT